VSRHWKPDAYIADCATITSRKSWPAGATAGLLLVAAACVGIAVALYQVAGPRDVFEAGKD